MFVIRVGLYLYRQYLNESCHSIGQVWITVPIALGVLVINIEPVLMQLVSVD